MPDRNIFLPILCPTCGRISSVAYTRMEIRALLNSSVPFRFYSPCHDVSWFSTEAQLTALFSFLEPSNHRQRDSAVNDRQKSPTHLGGDK